ncbi:hypothetical protein DFQ30_001396, partial [Apophysomyces sp. BC1015]
MLGNFSFGDYFKRDAIHYAWELLTRVYQLSPEKLTVTVYQEDDDAYDIWAKDIGVPLERIIRIGDNKGARYASDNFWQMADTGPCGVARLDRPTRTARETGVSDLTHNSLKVIADHIRACGFLIVDGVIPGNEGRGYVLRRIVRRAIRHGYKLGRKGPFFHRLVDDLVGEMGAAYLELKDARQRVTEVLRHEEERFFETIEHGMSMLDAALSGLDARGVK